MSTYVQKRLMMQVGTDVTASAPLVSSGGLVPNISLTPGAAVGDLLVWNGSAWVVQTPVARLLASGVATLAGLGVAVVASTLVAADSRIVLSVNSTPAATGVMQVNVRNPGVDFTIASSVNVVDNGVDVYWQLWSA